MSVTSRAQLKHNQIQFQKIRAAKHYARQCRAMYQALVPCLGHLKSIFGLNLSLYLDMAKNRLKVVQRQT